MGTLVLGQPGRLLGRDVGGEIAVVCCAAAALTLNPQPSTLNPKP